MIVITKSLPKYGHILTLEFTKKNITNLKLKMSLYPSSNSKNDSYAYTSLYSTRAIIIPFTDSRAGCYRAYHVILCIYVYMYILKQVGYCGSVAHGPALLSLAS